ncbi:MAG: 5-formyltetrahydrofolate cyclo-ligase [Muribaculaceae bacterium]
MPEDKASIRKRMRELKKLLTDSQKSFAEQSVIEQIESLKEFAKAEKVLLYYSLPDELPTHEMAARWSKTKSIYLPRVAGEDMEILPYSADSLASGSFSISEPQKGDILNPHLLDLVIVPAVAFDRHGNRVGRGKGFYDRFLTDLNVIKIGICYDFQIVEEIESSSHDIPVDMLVVATTGLKDNKRQLEN